MCNLFHYCVLRHLRCSLVILSFLELGGCLWVPQVKSLLSASWIQAKGGKHVFTYSTKNGCPLTPLGMYPYVVQIIVATREATVYRVTGSILSHKAVLTHCSDLSRASLQEITVRSQRIFQGKGDEYKNCFETRNVVRRHPHPKCNALTYSKHSTKFYDFEILVLEYAFHAEKEFPYPVVPIPKQPYELLTFARRVMMVRTIWQGCEMPLFSPDHKYPAFVDNSKITAEINDGKDEKCIKELCYVFGNPPYCRQDLNRLSNGSYFCISIEGRMFLDPDAGIRPHYGSPIVCNNTSLGMVTFDVIRQKPVYQDYLLTVTYLRIWPWVMEMKHKYWDHFWNRETWDSPYLEMRPYRIWPITTPAWNKNLTVEDYHYFRFITERPKDKKHGASRESGLRPMFLTHIYVALILIFSNF